MDKLLVALCAFVFGSASALADESDTKPQAPATTPSGTPLIGDFDKMSTEQDRAARAAAKAKWDKMTPEEKAAYKKAATKKALADITKAEEERAAQKAAQAAEKKQPEKEPSAK